uniref:Uncharacterized protein n=1 Tax=Trichuris muris TaxID=70415 RepID=A0A5S6QJY0_TRIMR
MGVSHRPLLTGADWQTDCRPTGQHLVDSWRLLATAEGDEAGGGPLLGRRSPAVTSAKVYWTSALGKGVVTDRMFVVDVGKAGRKTSAWASSIPKEGDALNSIRLNGCVSYSISAARRKQEPFPGIRFARHHRFALVTQRRLPSDEDVLPKKTDFGRAAFVVTSSKA